MDEIIEEVVEDEAVVDEDTYDNDKLQEENENEITKPRTSVTRDDLLFKHIETNRKTIAAGCIKKNVWNTTTI